MEGGVRFAFDGSARGTLHGVQRADPCLLKIPSAAEILAFGRIGVSSGHAPMRPPTLDALAGELDAPGG